MSQEQLRLLLVEQHAGWAQTLAPALKAKGLETTLCRHVEEACSVLQHNQADLIVVDLSNGAGATVGAGADLLHWLQAHPPAPPILAVGPRLAEPLRVRLLESWADDVLPLPLAVPEFVARCRALWRRSQLRLQQWQASQPLTRLSHGPIDMIVEEHRVWFAGHAVELTPREFRLLEHLLRHPGKVFDRDTLLEQVWGEFCSLELDPKTVDVHIRWLRLKLEVDPGAPELIKTVRGRGYVLG